MKELPDLYDFWGNMLDHEAKMNYYANKRNNAMTPMEWLLVAMPFLLPVGVLLFMIHRGTVRRASRSLLYELNRLPAKEQHEEIRRQCTNGGAVSCYDRGEGLVEN